LSAMILAQPARLQEHAAWFAFLAARADKNFLQFREAFREIRKEFRCHFAFVAASPQNARNHYPPWSLRIQEKIYQNE